MAENSFILHSKEKNTPLNIDYIGSFRISITILRFYCYPVQPLHNK